MQKDEEFFLTDEIISALKEEIPPEEYESFLKKIKENNPDALFNLSVICQYTGCSSDEFWIDVLQEAADLGSEDAKEQLADLCNIDSEEKKLPFSKRKKSGGFIKNWRKTAIIEAFLELDVIILCPIIQNSIQPLELNT